MNYPSIKLYGTDKCHKTHYYRLFLDKARLPYQFLDVMESQNNAEELRGLYKSKKLNFPTIIIGNKILRNPSNKDLNKWLAAYL